MNTLSDRIFHQKRWPKICRFECNELYRVKRLLIGKCLQGMDAGLGSITQTVNNNGSNGSGDLKETFIRKRVSSPNPISKGKYKNKY